MSASLEPKIRTYAGDYQLSACSDTVAAEHDLRKRVEAMWPDVKRPAKVIILPLEDYEIMLSDLAGQVFTPHRKALLVTLTEPPQPVKSRGEIALEWAKAIFYLATFGLCMLGLGALLDGHQ